MCDAGCDGSYAFGDLGNAIRRCREDVGVEIDLATGELTPKTAAGKSASASQEDAKVTMPPEDGFSKWHWAIGKIKYNLVDPNAADGVLVYLKSSLTGEEPADVLNYHREHADFPHQTTADQWFTESQFESYRRLGQHVVEQLFDKIEVKKRNPANIFGDLKEKWREQKKQ